MSEIDQKDLRYAKPKYKGKEGKEVKRQTIDPYDIGKYYSTEFITRF